MARPLGLMGYAKELYAKELLLAESKSDEPLHYKDVWPRERPRPLLTLAQLCGYLVSGMAGYLLHMAIHGH